MNNEKTTKEEFIRTLLVACKKYGVTDKNQINYIIATVGWETNHTFKPVNEAYWLSEDWRKKHLKYYPYEGKGYVQITWKANYKKFGKLLGVNLVSEPDLALKPSVAMDILVLGFRDGLFTGHKISDFIGGGKADYVGARKCINGHDKDVIIASMARKIERA